MRILIVIEYFYNHSRPIGGAERQLAKLAERFIDAGHDVTVVSGQWAWADARQLIQQGLFVERLFTFWGMFNLRGLRKFGYYTYLLSLAFYLWRNRKQYDVLHCHSAMPSAFVTALARRWLRKPSLARPMASGFPYGDISRMQLGESVAGSKFMLRYYPMIDRFIALNQDVITELKEIGINGDKIVEMPNGVEINGITPKTDYNLHHPITVTFVGRLHPQKGLDTLLKAVHQIQQDQATPQWQINLAGQGPLEANLRHLVRDLGLEEQVIFHGQLESVYPILAQSDIFILPSRAEGMSNALLEAMAFALPCLVSDIPANTQLIQDQQNGIVFQTDSITDLADRLWMLIESRQLREKVGIAARANILQNYTIDRIAERFLDVYAELQASTHYS